MFATVQVNVAASPAAPQNVGTLVHLTFSATTTGAGPLNYRLEIAAPRAAYSMMRDYSLSSAFDWDAANVEGPYSIRVTARDNSSGETSQQVISYTLNSLVTGPNGVVTATQHPLVLLYSAPTCPTGSTIRVQFQKQGSTATNTTNSRPCRPGSMNFQIAGLNPNTLYSMNHYVKTNGVETPGPANVVFRSGPLDPKVVFTPGSIPVPVGPNTESEFGILLNSFSNASSPFATDLSGKVVWYYPFPDFPPPQLDRPVAGGGFLIVANAVNSGTGSGVWGNQGIQWVAREIDLTGATRRETNIDRVNEQLQVLGNPDAIDHFDHEVLRLPNGNTLALAGIQRIFPAGTQGSATPINILGDAIVLLDPNFQVLWYWNAFQHTGPGQLDINRAATLGETCVTGPRKVVGCPPQLLQSPGADWLHANALQYLPDGNIICSLRHQDWIIKIDFHDGTGTGNILWKMGLQGDFTMTGSSDPYPWFSHQHEPGFANGGTQLLSVFDNGNVRVGQFGGNSRGQIFKVDEAHLTVSPALNADLGVYSAALGSAQILPNNHKFFGAGDIASFTPAATQGIELDQNGNVSYLQQTNTVSYRSWRMTDFYAPLGN